MRKLLIILIFIPMIFMSCEDNVVESEPKLVAENLIYGKFNIQKYTSGKFDTLISDWMQVVEIKKHEMQHILDWVWLDINYISGTGSGFSGEIYLGEGGFDEETFYSEYGNFFSEKKTIIIIFTSKDHFKCLKGSNYYTGDRIE